MIGRIRTPKIIDIPHNTRIQGQKPTPGRKRMARPNNQTKPCMPPYSPRGLSVLIEPKRAVKANATKRMGKKKLPPRRADRMKAKASPMRKMPAERARSGFCCRYMRYFSFF
jgi:hypothetical protein